MYRAEVSHQDGRRLTQIAETAATYGTPEAALSEVLPPAKAWAEIRRQPLWLRIYDEDSHVVFGTLLP